MPRAVLKAGLVGGGLAIVLVLMSRLPRFGWIPCLGIVALWTGVGAWAVSLGREHVVTAGEAAVAGALAGAITAAFGAVVNIGLEVVGATMLGLFTGPPYNDVLAAGHAFRSLVVESVGWLVGIVMGGVLGALGGLVWMKVGPSSSTS